MTIAEFDALRDSLESCIGNWMDFVGHHSISEQVQSSDALAERMTAAALAAFMLHAVVPDMLDGPRSVV